MTGTGERLTHTLTGADIWRQAGPLWVSPSCDTILFCYLTEGQQVEERGRGEGRHSASRLERDAGKKAPPTRSRNPPSLPFSPPRTHSRACHTQPDPMHPNVYARFHHLPPAISPAGGRAVLPGSSPSPTALLPPPERQCQSGPVSPSASLLTRINEPGCFCCYPIYFLHIGAVNESKIAAVTQIPFSREHHGRFPCNTFCKRLCVSGLN